MFNLLPSQEGFESAWQVVQTTFEQGLGTYGLKAIGTFIIFVGAALLFISYFVHKANQQSRMPGWFTWLVVVIVGIIARDGITKPLAVLTKFKEWLFSLFGAG